MRAKKTPKSGNRKQAAYRFSPQFIEVLKAASQQSGISQSRIIERCVLANVDSVTAVSTAEAALLNDPKAAGEALARALVGVTNSTADSLGNLLRDALAKSRRRQV